MNFLKYLKNFNKINYKNLLKDENRIAEVSIKHGLYALLVFFIIFLFWAIFLPISSAVISEGMVVLDFNRKIIQHLEGGIVENILVKEGDFVAKDQPLVYLRDVNAKSDRKTILTKLWTMKLQKERLLAEKNNHEKIDIKKFLTEIGKISDEFKLELEEIIITQNQLFLAREEKEKGEISVLEKKLIESENYLQSLFEQKKSSQKKINFINEELVLVRPLVKDNIVSITRKNDLEKQFLDAKSRKLEIESEIDKTNQQIAQNKLQIVNYKNETLSKVLDELKQTESEIFVLENELKKTQDVMQRLVINSPVDGNVMDIKYHTIGAVVQSAAPIMTIVPRDENLIVEAKIRPQDIDSVHKNLSAKVMLTAYKEKKVPKLNGEVINVSPDIFVDEKAQQSYYIARIKINENEVQKLKNKIEISPGMPAQIFIITGKRTLLDYLFTPIKDSAYKAFREE